MHNDTAGFNLTCMAVCTKKVGVQSDDIFSD
jgi:hypothetical protein